MAVTIKDGNNTNQTLKTLTDALSPAGTPSAEVLTVQGDPAGVPIPIQILVPLGATAQPVSLASAPLPSGAATDSTLTAVGNAIVAGNAKLDTLHADELVIEGKLDATNTKLDTLHTDLTSSNTKADANTTALGTIGASPPTLAGTGIMGLLRWLGEKFSLGTGTAAAALRVVLASDQAAVPISMPDTFASGTITAANATPTGVATANSTVEISADGAAFIAMNLSGTFSSNMTVWGTIDNVTWFQITTVFSVSSINQNYQTAFNASNINIPYLIPCVGCLKVRVSASSIASGSVTVNLRAARQYAQIPVSQTSGVNSISIGQILGNAVANPGFTGGLPVGGPVAHSQASTANPVIAGGKVVTAPDTTLAQGDVAQMAMTTSGAQIVKTNGPPESDFQYAATITTNTQTAIKAAAAGLRNYVTALQYQNTSATTSLITIQDGNTTIWQGSMAASMAAPAVITFPTPLKPTTNTALNVTLATTGTNTLVNVQGFQGV